MSTENKILSRKAAALRLGLSERTLDRLCETGSGLHKVHISARRVGIAEDEIRLPRTRCQPSASSGLAPTTGSNCEVQTMPWFGKFAARTAASSSRSMPSCGRITTPRRPPARVARRCCAASLSASRQRGCRSLRKSIRRKDRLPERPAGGVQFHQQG
jgi:hypothetical protein